MLSYNLEKSLSLLLVETIRNFHHALLVLFPREMVFDNLGITYVVTNLWSDPRQLIF